MEADGRVSGEEREGKLGWEKWGGRVVGREGKWEGRWARGWGGRRARG